VTFPTASGPWTLPPELRAKFATTYRRVDLQAELVAAATWLDCNPARRKTPKGMPRFLNAWLSKNNTTARQQAIKGAYTAHRPETGERTRRYEAEYGRLRAAGVGIGEAVILAKEAAGIMK
jgi:hypothetical protein